MSNRQYSNDEIRVLIDDVFSHREKFNDDKSFYDFIKEKYGISVHYQKRLDKKGNRIKCIDCHDCLRYLNQSQSQALEHTL